MKTRGTHIQPRKPPGGPGRRETGRIDGSSGESSYSPTELNATELGEADWTVADDVPGGYRLPDSPSFPTELNATELVEAEWTAEDVHGGSVPANLVLAALQREFNYLQSRKVYSYPTEAEAWSNSMTKSLPSSSGLTPTKGICTLSMSDSALCVLRSGEKHGVDILSDPPVEDLANPFCASRLRGACCLVVAGDQTHTRSS